MQSFVQDLRYSARMHLSSRGFTMIAVITLALGIGANTAIFSVVNTVLLRPLPFKEPNRLVVVSERRPNSGETNLPLAAYEFLRWRDQAHTFEGMGLAQPVTFNLTGTRDAQTINAWQVSAELFPVLGINPILGRVFTSEEDRAGRNNIVVLNQDLWQRCFDSAPDIVGKTVSLSDQSYTVVGVMPHLDLMPDAWLPMDLPAAGLVTGVNSHNSFSVIGRLKPRASLEQAQSDVAYIARQLEEEDPGNNTGHGVHISFLHEATVGNVSRALWILFGAVGFVLLIACANVTNLLLARITARQKEIAIRTALGATRLRLARQLLTESMLLSALGGGVGLLLALWLTDLLPKLNAVNIPRMEQITVDGRVLAATIGFSLLTGVLTAVGPAWRNLSPSLSQSLNEGTRASAGLSRRRAANLLVILEVSLTLILLIGSGLMMRSFIRLVRVDPGFNPNNVLRVDLALPPLRYARPEQQTIFYDDLVERIKALPGVEGAAATSQTPLRGNGNWASVSLEGRPAADPGHESYAAVCGVSIDYFRVMSIPMRRGRTFNEFDGAQALPAVIVNETMARQFWPAEDPLGKRFSISGSAPLTVVGIVGDVRHSGLNYQPNSEFFVPIAQSPQASMAVMVRTSNDPLILAAAVREQIKALDPDLPAPIATMNQLFNNSVAGQRFNALLLSVFGILALGLAIVGIFGVINYSVEQRTHELGVRIAVGAQRRDIFKLVIGQGLALALMGIGIGVVGALALTGLVSDLLFDVSPTDPETFVAVSLLLATVSLVACYVPARRATQVDPIVALKHE